jgi:hypothetical protein
MRRDGLLLAMPVSVMRRVRVPIDPYPALMNAKGQAPISCARLSDCEGSELLLTCTRLSECEGSHWLCLA